ncbi:MAG: HAD family hydrolase, partial [Alphaproteobacteria bacterium]|nr:HAD family hydrolase [Alphaproteobacteria bacterium]
MDSPIPFQAILFDLDGTLVDSVGDLRAALNQVLADSGRREVSIAQVKRMIGDGAAKLIERGFAATGPVPDAETLTKKLARFLEIYESASTVLSRPFDGVVETLSDLHRIGIRLGICTNKPWAATTRMLHELGLT